MFIEFCKKVFRKKEKEYQWPEPAPKPEPIPIPKEAMDFVNLVAMIGNMKYDSNQFFRLYERISYFINDSICLLPIDTALPMGYKIILKSKIVRIDNNRNEIKTWIRLCNSNGVTIVDPGVDISNPCEVYKVKKQFITDLTNGFAKELAVLFTPEITDRDKLMEQIINLARAWEKLY